MSFTAPQITFFLVGAARSGSTSLQRYVGQHPDVYLPTVKSRHFAISHLDGVWAGPGDRELRANSAVTSAQFAALYSAYVEEPQIGDAAGLYLYTPGVANDLASRYKDARIIVALRDPAERAFSAYQIMRRRRLEPLETFSAALEAESERIAAGWSFAWHYARASHYHEQLARYFAAFPRKNILVLTYDALCEDPVTTTQRAYRFLGVDDAFEPDTTKIYSASGASRIPVLDRAVLHPGTARKLARRIVPKRLRHAIARSEMLSNATSTNLSKPEMPESDRASLARTFREDIERVQALCEIDLSSWLT